MDELKPCPFCGGEAVFDYCTGGRPRHITFCFIKCRTCRGQTGIFAEEDKYGNKISASEDAAFAWNRRASNGDQ